MKKKEVHKETEIIDEILNEDLKNKESINAEACPYCKELITSYKSEAEDGSIQCPCCESKLYPTTKLLLSKGLFRSSIALFLIVVLISVVFYTDVNTILVIAASTVALILNITGLVAMELNKVHYTIEQPKNYKYKVAKNISGLYYSTFEAVLIPMVMFLIWFYIVTNLYEFDSNSKFNQTFIYSNIDYNSTENLLNAIDINNSTIFNKLIAVPRNGDLVILREFRPNLFAIAKLYKEIHIVSRDSNSSELNYKFRIDLAESLDKTSDYMYIRPELKKVPILETKIKLKQSYDLKQGVWGMNQKKIIIYRSHSNFYTFENGLNASVLQDSIFVYREETPIKDFNGMSDKKMFLVRIK